MIVSALVSLAAFAVSYSQTPSSVFLNLFSKPLKPEPTPAPEKTYEK
jgi:hypothetical protein